MLAHGHWPHHNRNAILGCGSALMCQKKICLNKYTSFPGFLVIVREGVMEIMWKEMWIFTASVAGSTCATSDSQDVSVKPGSQHAYGSCCGFMLHWSLGRLCNFNVPPLTQEVKTNLWTHMILSLTLISSTKSKTIIYIYSLLFFWKLSCHKKGTQICKMTCVCVSL